MTKVLVTGASGYIGAHVVNALVARGADVVAISRGVSATDVGPAVVKCSIADIDANWLTERGPFDVVLHLAWTDGFDHNASSHIDNLPLHVRFVREVMLAKIPQFVGLGTMHEIGYWQGEIGEATPTKPRSLYGIAKNALREVACLETENACATFQWLRPYYILGDDERNNSIFSKILRLEAEGKATFPFNSGVNRYDFIDVRDLAEQIAAASLQKDVAGVIECSSGKAVALRDKVESFIAERQLRIRPEFGAFPDRPYDSPAVWGSTEKISKIMGRRAPPRHDSLSRGANGKSR
ncbi:MAG: NAD-dependent epimerase/dehydratase family protein [Rhizomicrobium sp.]